MKYNKKFVDSQEVKSLASKYKISLLLASILVRRNIKKPEEVKFYLQDDVKYLHNPFLFDQMEDAVDRISAAAAEGEKAMIFGDRDTDGISSTVLLIEQLGAMGIDVSWKVPEGDEPYGLTMEAVEKAAEKDVTLLITVDCGISNLKEIKRASELSIDTIIIDHHTAPAEIPECFAVINPKIQGCGYPFRDLAGCGVAAKLIWALEFSKTNFYKKNISLLNIRPGNGGSYIFEAVKLYNMAEISRISETIVPGILKGISSTRLADYFNGSLIITFGAKNQKRIFSEIFSKSVELETFDLAPTVYELFPAFTGMGLLKMKEISRDSRYSSEETGEIDILFSLFKSVIFKKYPSLSEDYEKILSMAALGSIADLMPLNNENRIIVKKGLKNISSTENRGLRELLCRQKIIEKEITANDIAWNISPVINASGRMGVPSKAVNLFLNKDIKEVKELTDEIIALNKQRKKLGDDYWEKLMPSAKESCEDFGSSLVCAGGKGVPRGITGILASRFANFFNVPVIIFANLDDKVIGSIRSIRNYSITDLMDFCSEFFLDYGGHDFAGGFSMPFSNLEGFRKKLAKYVEEVGIDIPDKEPLEIDAELPEGYLSEEILEAVEKLNPYGEGSLPLIFLAKRLLIRTLEIVGQKEIGHVRLSLDSGKNIWPAIYWNSSERAKRDFDIGDKVDAIFKIENKFFRGRTTPQLVILDMERA